MGFREVVFPVRHDRPYGLASGAFLILVVFAEIEGLAAIALGLVAHHFDLFAELQVALAPGAFLVAIVCAVVIGIESRATARRVKRYTKVGTTAEVRAFAERVAKSRPRV